MDARNVAEKLNTLIQLDIDAVGAYNQAIDEIDEPDVRDRLEGYRDDHEQHISDLSDIVVEMGEEPVERSKDFKGFLLGGFTKILSMGGTDSALKAMESNEKITNKKYAEAMDWDFGPEIHGIIRKNLEDENEHLEYIERTLGHEVDVDQYHHA